MTLAAGVFLALFGAAGAVFVTTRFPNARFMRTCYVLMCLGGALFVVWSFWKFAALGIAAVVTVGIGAVVGIAGALRKELRFTPLA